MTIKEFLQVLPKEGNIAFFSDGMITHSAEIYAQLFYAHYAFNPIAHDATIQSVHGAKNGLLLLCVHSVDYAELLKEWPELKN